MSHYLKIKIICVFFRPGKVAIGLFFFVFYIPCFAFDYPDKEQSIVIINASSFNRVREVIIIKRTLLGKPGYNFFPLVKKGNRFFTTQIVDKNGDSNWDELLIEVDLAANTRDTLQLTWVKKEQQKEFKKYTNVRLSLRSDNDVPSPEINKTQRMRGFTQNIAKPFYQMEGPGIENDKVAFRTFFDFRNGKDIYGKIVDTPVLEKVGVDATWHEMQPWGMDIFHTGNSLSAGALAVEEDKQFYRLGDADTSIFQALYEGALQAAFTLNYKKWDVAKSKQDGSETVSMTKGNFFYKNDIVVDLNSNQSLIAGIANFGIDKVVYKKHNETFSSVSIYGSQAEGSNTKLGVAIMFPSHDYIVHQTTDAASSIPNTSYISLKPTSKKTIYFFACWEKTDSRFTTQEGFEKYLKETADKLASPIIISVINKK